MTLPQLPDGTDARVILSYSEAAVHPMATAVRFERDMPAISGLGRSWQFTPFWNLLGGLNSDGRDWGVDELKARRWKQMREPLEITTLILGFSLGAVAGVTALVCLITYLERKNYVAEVCTMHWDCREQGGVIHPIMSWTPGKVLGTITAGFGVATAAPGAACYKSHTLPYTEFQNPNSLGFRQLKHADAEKLQRQGLLGFEAARRLRVAQAIERDLETREKMPRWFANVEKLKQTYLPHDPDGFDKAYDEAWDRKNTYFTTKRQELDQWYAEGAYLDYFAANACTTRVMSLKKFKSKLT
jgi:hypothetical protein